jgi:peptidoglycan/LPS O-acetylase OafA/YrhL
LASIGGKQGGTGVPSATAPAGRSAPVVSASFSAFLDVARALAAIMVVLEHLRMPIFPGFSHLPPDAQTPFVRGWFFFAGFGFEAVMVFFVLSGFLIGGIGVNKLRESTFKTDWYSADRLSRLYIVFLPALVLTVLLDRLGPTLFPDAGYWTNENPVLSPKYPESFLGRGGLGTFACNLFMLQSFYCPVLGSNVPLWTLSYEFWFYTVFGLAASAVLVRGLPRLALILAIPLIFALLGPGFLWMLAVWLLGIAAYLYRGRSLRWPLASVPVWAALAVLSRLTEGWAAEGRMAYNVIILAQGAAFAWVLISFRDKDYRWLRRLAPLGKHLAGFSYTLYLVHFPVMLVATATLATLLGVDDLTRSLSPTSITGISVYLGSFLVTLALAWTIARFTEDHTHKLRAWLRGRLGRRSPRPPGRA